MKKILIILLGTLMFLGMRAQTVIEMTNPGDAEVILLEVDDSLKADIIVYKTNDNKEASQWDCMWKFKKWGFSNFGVYITKDENDPLMSDEEYGMTYIFSAKVYFTDNKTYRGYRGKTTGIDGVMRIQKRK